MSPNSASSLQNDWQFPTRETAGRLLDHGGHLRRSLTWSGQRNSDGVQLRARESGEMESLRA